jgi:quinol-cytochrome oxidoreductase complex cytochrome b subunit
MFLHEYGSNSPLGMLFKGDMIFLSPFYFIKDFLGINIVIIFLFYLVFFLPRYLSHYDNYVLSNVLVTPLHIVPE